MYIQAIGLFGRHLRHGPPPTTLVWPSFQSSEPVAYVDWDAAPFRAGLAGTFTTPAHHLCSVTASVPLIVVHHGADVRKRPPHPLLELVSYPRCAKKILLVTHVTDGYVQAFQMSQAGNYRY
jgi:hypothetical protein